MDDDWTAQCPTIIRYSSSSDFLIAPIELRRSSPFDNDMLWSQDRVCPADTA